MPLARRTFLGTLAGALACAPRLFAGAPDDFDEHLALFLSDFHVNGAKKEPVFQRERLMAIVAEVLRMHPLPRHVVCFGDGSYFYGFREDYVALLEILKPLFAAGMRFTFGLGNHDARGPFGEVFAPHLPSSPVPGRRVGEMTIGALDLVMLDSLHEVPGPDGNPSAGALDAAQRDWLEARLAGARRPVLVCAHHDARSLALVKTLCGQPRVAGYVHGHWHHWGRVPLSDGWQGWHAPRVVWDVCLPSTGHWGDIGYALLRVKARRAELRLHQSDCFFPRPLPPGQRPAAWDEAVRRNQGASCVFPLAAASPASACRSQSREAGVGA